MVVEQESGAEGQATQAVIQSLTERIESGELQPGVQLPTQRDLAKEYGVAPGTVGGAVAALKGRGLLEAYPGRGTFVRGGPTPLGAPAGSPVLRSAPAVITLEQSLQQALLAKKVRIDALSWTGETFAQALSTELNRVRYNLREPIETIDVRLLLTDPRFNSLLGQRVDGQQDERLQRRIEGIAAASVAQIVNRLDRLMEYGRVGVATCKVRTLPSMPLHKLYVLNGKEVLYGPYEFGHSPLRMAKDEPDVMIHDIFGHGATMVRFREGEADDPNVASMVESHVRHFDSLWSGISSDSPLGGHV